MSLKGLDIKTVYDSDTCSLIDDFYIPVLSNSIKYDRIAGYFCSNSLAIAAKGISGLIKNGGKIRLIANVVISEEDHNEIKKYIENIEQEILIELDQLENALQKNHIRVLGWLLKEELLEIKIAVVPTGIEHQKTGILEDTENNILSFSGSDNETAGGWINNHEKFHVFCNWREGDLPHLSPDVKGFKDLWEDRGSYVRVYPVSEAFKKGLIRLAPRDSEEFVQITEDIHEYLIKYKKRCRRINGKKIELRPYQLDAIERWVNNEYIGIFEMATGTGKTFTALGCVSKLLEDIDSIVIVISCPYNHLVQQWLDSISSFGFSIDTTVADSSNYKWKNELMDKIYDMRNKLIDKLIIVTTHDTFSSETFISRIKDVRSPIILICDEVHGIGSEERKNGLIEELYKYRLGLSATPTRWFDEDGTELIMKFFGGTVYEFSLKEAINTINTLTGKTFLCKYDYKPIFVKLSDEELIEYEKETKKIAKSYFTTKDKKEKLELFNLLCIKRQKIITNSKEKYSRFNELLEEIKPVKHCLVYVSPEQKDIVRDIIYQKNIKHHKFTSEEGVKPDVKFGGISERSLILKEFENGLYEILLAMKCLDEGVDIISARIAIILASSGNPKEYIQRRGRILRPHPGKEKAIIYDFIVIPPLKNIKNKELNEIEMKILDKEFLRYKEFADASDNKVECLKKIFEFQKEFL